MAALTDYLENKIVDWLLRGQSYPPPATSHTIRAQWDEESDIKGHQRK